MSRAQIIGWSHSQFGKSAHPDTEHLIAEILAPALEHAGVSADAIDGIFVGVFNNGFSRQDFQAALVALADERMRHVPAMRFENACATRSAALYGAMDFIESGRGKIAVVVGAQKMTATLNRAIGFRARVQANDFLPLSRRDILAFTGARKAWAGVLADAGVTLDDLSLVETHDCFTIAEMLEYEAMGLAEPGQGHRVIRDGTTTKQGGLPVNPSGGLKSKGHPIGATGVSQHVMAAMQLAGEAGGMQIPGANLAGVFNMGGAAVANYCSILERVK